MTLSKQVDELIKLLDPTHEVTVSDILDIPLKFPESPSRMEFLDFLRKLYKKHNNKITYEILQEYKIFYSS